MANPELGTKQICPNCQAKFYDLSKRPAHCPKCAHDFDPDEAVRNRRVRARTIVPEAEEAEDQVVEKETDDDEEEEEGAVTPELDEVVNDPTLAGDTDDDDDAAEPAAVSEDLGEFTDEEEVEDDADVPFLEDEDEDDFDESEIEGLPDGDDDR
ncbi:TIGR02300 family protein [Brevundimonas sp.]|uniref:TIGR02300 family protein n=1 Tax=Brevundimonas sp. TaxID=1871086 RepID=UPI00286A9015|nr:TIGR02300 family protein [Brevundimonas sp.]